MAKYRVTEKVSIASKLGDFLKKEGLLKEVIEETRSGSSFEEPKNKIILIDLNECFYWGESKRGWNFWRNVSDKFEE